MLWLDVQCQIIIRFDRIQFIGNIQKYFIHNKCSKALKASKLSANNELQSNWTELSKQHTSYKQ